MNDTEKQASVPFFVHEGALARMERIHRITVFALVIALIVCLVAFVINDCSWRRHYDTLDTRYVQLVERINGESDGVHEQSDSSTD